jgi:hypothetical protein
MQTDDEIAVSDCIEEKRKLGFPRFAGHIW